MDDGSPLRLLIWILLLLLGSAYFAAAEISLTSVNRIRIMGYADDGDKRAQRVMYILNHFDRALTTLLVGNNILHIACASLTTVFVTRVWGTEAVAAAPIITALVVFLFAETLPKSFARACNEGWALTIGGSMLVVMRVLKPLAVVFSKVADVLSKPFRTEETAPTVTEDELRDIVESIVEEGDMDEEEGELVQNALDFAETAAREIYTPWYKIVRVSLSMPAEMILAVIQSCGHSRLPVTGKGGAVMGILPIRAYLRAYLQDPDITLSDVMVDAHFVRADMAIDELMAAMSANKTHMAVVLGGAGETLGVVTMEDILEELVGEIYDEEDPEGGAA